MAIYQITVGADLTFSVRWRGGHLSESLVPPAIERLRSYLASLDHAAAVDAHSAIAVNTVANPDADFYANPDAAAEVLGKLVWVYSRDRALPQFEEQNLQAWSDIYSGEIPVINQH